MTGSIRFDDCCGCSHALFQGSQSALGRRAWNSCRAWCRILKFDEAKYGDHQALESSRR